MHADTMRETQMNVRLSPEESARVDALAEHYGLSAPNLVRMLIKREFDALKLSAPQPTTKKGRR